MDTDSQSGIATRCSGAGYVFGFRASFASIEVFGFSKVIGVGPLAR